jgi:hypothetical protein
VVLTVQLTARNPATISERDMQDLHFRRDIVAACLAAGHDCAMARGNEAEIAVFDGAACIEILSVASVGPDPVASL